jgi:hypothetical protein
MLVFQSTERGNQVTESEISRVGKAAPEKLGEQEKLSLPEKRGHLCSGIQLPLG